jgi:rRNA-processing protein FCF1
VKKPKLLLLDADVIVFAHQFGIWQKLKASYEVHVPATVIDEAQFFETKDEQRKIDLKAQEAAGEIKRL